MGEDISTSDFAGPDFKEFQQRLRAENDLLKSWFDEGRMSTNHWVGGTETEAWLIGPDCVPRAANDAFLDHLNSPLVVPELSQFTVEFNSLPEKLEGRALSNMQAGLEGTWAEARTAAADLDLDLVAIGILPTVQDSELTIENMSTAARYRALNDQVFKLRRGYPIRLEMHGTGSLNSRHMDVMLESATTSFQVHFKIPADEGAAYYNVSKILAAPTVAIAANSPYLFGQDLWDETRIPLFEQGVSMGRWNYAQRVTFGARYIEDSLWEVFHANRQRYPVLLPHRFDSPPEEMRHVRLHNSTIWRWVRPIVDFDRRDGTPHVRIEHRVMPAGPTIADQIANAAFYYGLARRLAPEFETLRWDITFADARENFYAAARHGLKSEVRWTGGRRVAMADLILEELLPIAHEGLSMLGLHKDDISDYLNIIEARARTGQNGAGWQRAHVARHGADMAALCAAYRERQRTGAPVHEWSL